MQRVVDGLAVIIMKVGYTCIDKIALILVFLLWSNFRFFSWSLSHCKNTINRLKLYPILFAIRSHFKYRYMYCKIWLKQIIKVSCYVYPIFANICDIFERIRYILHISIKILLCSLTFTKHMQKISIERM